MGQLSPVMICFYLGQAEKQLLATIRTVLQAASQSEKEDHAEILTRLALQLCAATATLAEEQCRASKQQTYEAPEADRLQELFVDNLENISYVAEGTGEIPPWVCCSIIPPDKMTPEQIAGMEAHAATLEPAIGKMGQRDAGSLAWEMIDDVP
jgi:hypothetical protein